MTDPADVEKLIDNSIVFREFGESVDHEVALSTLAREWLKMREALEIASAELHIIGRVGMWNVDHVIDAIDPLIGRSGDDG